MIFFDTINQGLSDLLAKGDPRMHYFLMDSPITVHLIVIFYLVFIFKLGPSFMKNREPFVLKKAIMTYNVLQIVLNLGGSILALEFLPEMSIFCTPIDTGDSRKAYTLLVLSYFYTVMKFMDFFDTIFFVLRKKNNQITFLHIYHHTLMSVGCWWTCKFYPGGHGYFVGVPNGLVHVVMYFYYFLTVWKPSYKKSVWWKKHITELQLAQHCFILVALIMPLFSSTCTYPKPLLIMYIPLMLVMIYLFADFYVKTYLRKPQNKMN